MYQDKHDIVIPRYSNGELINKEDEKFFKNLPFTPIEGEKTNTGYLYKKKVKVIEVDAVNGDERSINELELSVRSMNCLKYSNILTLDDLVQKTAEELLRIPDFGRKSLNEIKEVLKSCGLELNSRIRKFLVLSTINTFEVEVGKLYNKSELIQFLINKNIEFEVIPTQAKEVQLVTK